MFDNVLFEELNLINRCLCNDEDADLRINKMINIIQDKTKAKLEVISGLVDDKIISKKLYNKLKQRIVYDNNLAFFYAIRKFHATSNEMKDI